jgi:hypothetical protein
VLSGAFANVAGEGPSGGVVLRSGYCFQMYLPDVDCRGVPEAADGGQGPVWPNGKLSEVIWCCYAWPTAYGKSGRRAFFVDQSGDVLATDNEAQRYSGLAHAPRSAAAYLAASTERGMARPPAANARGEDLARWIVVN